MYENARVIYDNYLNDATLNATDQGSAAYGIFGGVIKDGSGSAVMSCYTAGSGYSYCNDLLYTIQIDSVTAGKEIGNATFKWRTNETAAGSWEATGVATSLSAVHLSNQVDVSWVNGTGDDFELGDKFYFNTLAVFAVTKAQNERRDNYYRSRPTTSAKIGFDLGSARRVRVVALMDITFSNSAVVNYVRLKGGSVYDTWGYTEDFVLSESSCVLYLDQTYRYWQIEINASTNQYTRIGQIFLGDYVEFQSGAMYNWGSSERLISEMSDSALFDYPRRILTNRRELTLKWQNVHTDYRSYFDNLYAATRQASDGMEHPVFVHLDPTDDSETLYWMKLITDLDREWSEYQHDSLTLQFREVPANYAE